MRATLCVASIRATVWNCALVFHISSRLSGAALNTLCFWSSTPPERPVNSLHNIMGWRINSTPPFLRTFHLYFNDGCISWLLDEQARWLPRHMIYCTVRHTLFRPWHQNCSLTFGIKTSRFGFKSFSSRWPRQIKIFVNVNVPFHTACEPRSPGQSPLLVWSNLLLVWTLSLFISPYIVFYMTFVPIITWAKLNVRDI